MLTLNDGRTELWQWDTNRKLTVDADCSQVHFSNKVFGRSIDVDVVDGIAIIPDILLQTDKDLAAWAFVGTAENGYTKISKVFKVNKRNKPADYVFTPPEQTSLEEILEKIDYLESQVPSDGDSSAFYIAISEENGSYVMDKTFPELKEAHETGRPVYAIVTATSNKLNLDHSVFQLHNAFSFFFVFGTFTADSLLQLYIQENGPLVLTRKKFAVESSIPNKLPNPNALTFTGAVSGTYDGSDPVTIDIPNASGGNAVLYTEQNLTYDQQMQARKNIGVLEPFGGSTVDTTPAQISQAMMEGRNVVVLHNDPTYGFIYFNGFVEVPALDVIASSGVMPYGNTVMRFSLIGDVSNASWYFDYGEIATKDNIPTALPNPNALTFTGAVSGSYDGSAPVTINIPDSGGNGDLGVTGATVGQTVKISAVDENGVPTAWEPTDFPSGGGGEWKLLADITTEEPINKILIDEGIPDGVTGVYMFANAKYAESSNYNYIAFQINERDAFCGNKKISDKETCYHCLLDIHSDGTGHMWFSMGTNYSIVGNAQFSISNYGNNMDSFNRDLLPVTEIGVACATPSLNFAVGTVLKIYVRC